MADPNATKEQVLKDLAELQAAAREYGGKIPQMEKAVSDLSLSVRKLQELQAVENREAYDTRGADFVVSRSELTDATPVVRQSDGGRGVLKTSDSKNAVVLRTMRNRDGDEIPGLLDTPAEPGTWEYRAQELHDRAVIVRALCGPQSMPRTLREVRRHWDRAPGAIKTALKASFGDDYTQRIFADSSAIGAEFVPDIVSTRLEMTLRAQRRVAALFETVENAPKEWRLPFLTSGATPYLKGSVTADDPAQNRASSVATAQRSFSAKGVAVRVQLDEDMIEDSIIPAMPLLEGEIVAAHNDGEEDAWINGDTAGTHQDTALASWNPRSRWDATALGGADDFRKWFIGLRARAYDVSNTLDRSSTNTYAGLLAAKATLASPHGVEGDCVMVVSPEEYLTMLGTWTQILTLDLFGPNAAVLTGQVASIANTPVVVSEFLTADLQATGLFTTTGGTKTGYLVFNRKRFIRLSTRGITIERDKDVTRGVHHLVATRRGTAGTFDSASHKNVHFAFNL